MCDIPKIVLMKKARVFFLLLALVTSIILTAGCISLPREEKSVSNLYIIPAGTYNPPFATPTTSQETENQIPGNVTGQGMLITIDPIPDHSIGDTFSVTGTTTFSPDIPLTAEIFYGAFHTMGKSQPGRYTGSIVNATISGNRNGVSHWVAVVNTSGYNRTGTQDDWIVVVSPGLQKTSDNSRYQNATSFTFLSRSRTQEQ
ncbi:MAG: hypothetical protein WCX22_04545 [Methanoregula sp.]